MSFHEKTTNNVWKFSLEIGANLPISVILLNTSFYIFYILRSVFRYFDFKVNLDNEQIN